MLDRPEGNSEWSESRPGSANGSPDVYDRPGGGHPLIHPAALHHFRPPAGSPPDNNNHPHHTPGNSTNSNVMNKPRIWSLADMASKETKESGGEGISPPTSLYAHSQHSSPGKLLSPLAGRMTNYSPYTRPELYRGFYGPAAAHLHGPPSEFLEHHQRSFGATLAHNGLGVNPLLWKAAVSSGSQPFAPLSLTTNHQTAPPSGVSPSASSSSSSLGGDQQHQQQSQPISSTIQTTLPTQGPASSNSTSSSSGKLSPGLSNSSNKP